MIHNETAETETKSSLHRTIDCEGLSMRRIATKLDTMVVEAFYGVNESGRTRLVAVQLVSVAQRNGSTKFTGFILVPFEDAQDKGLPKVTYIDIDVNDPDCNHKIESDVAKAIGPGRVAISDIEITKNGNTVGRLLLTVPA